ncbi:O-antigen ligase family protein [Streptomyces sp. H27-C3]|uniref:O-antigen ligase family protein n=1 Tax=Streptomyces sp. H27-C3 TaxID=3046305 RepID=UPI0024B8DF74|nr:O-antigen ligase family protein [Streptomyces sp. H27-C3]MDJ0460252.1 O-antigen ligase family protein [Streptomyces sp. H27-C3]
MTATWTDAPAPRAASHPGFRRQAARWGPLLPLIVTVLLLAAPIQAELAGSSSSVSPADIASGVLVAFCVGRALRCRLRPLTPAAVVVLGIPAVGFAVATITAADPVASLPGFVRYLQVFVLVPVAVVLLIRDASAFRIVTGCLVALALVQGATGVYQYATGTGASYMGEDIRAVGTFGPTDVMGMATVVAYGLLAAVALALCTPQGAPRWLRPCALAAAAALVVPLALSFSRGAWIATVVAAVAMVLLTGWRQAVRALTVVTAAAVVLVGGFGVGSEMISQRLTSITDVTEAPDQSVNDRYTMWAAAASMWREQPATGVGLKGFPAHRDGHASIGLSSGSDTAGAGQAFQKQPLLSPHNMYLLVLSEQGLIGVTAFVGSWAAVLVGTVRRLALARKRRQAAADCGLAAVGLITWQTVDFLYADIGGPSTVLAGVVLGLAAWWAFARQDEAIAA